MKILEILGQNRFSAWTKHRTACRGIVMRGEQVLLSYETARDQYGIPGGGLEAGETFAQCCAREIAEETGVLVSVGEQLLTIHEFYEEYLYETHFFLCKAVGETVRALTAREREVGMVPQWVDLKDAVAVFSRHQDYAQTDEEKRGIYLREYLALNELIETEG